MFTTAATIVGMLLVALLALGPALLAALPDRHHTSDAALTSAWTRHHSDALTTTMDDLRVAA